MNFDFGVNADELNRMFQYYSNWYVQEMCNVSLTFILFLFSFRNKNFVKLLGSSTFKSTFVKFHRNCIGNNYEKFSDYIIGVNITYSSVNHVIMANMVVANKLCVVIDNRGKLNSSVTSIQGKSWKPNYVCRSGFPNFFIKMRLFIDF